MFKKFSRIVKDFLAAFLVKMAAEKLIKYLRNKNKKSETK